MKTYICTSCDSGITVGFPRAYFRRRARALAKDSYSLLTRLFLRRRIMRKLLDALEQRYYLDPDHHPALPRACPKCGHKGRGDLPWWRPGVALSGD